MALRVGTRLGSYEIVALLGVGGMGEVYRAHDTKLGRDVAIKVLPEAFASDPERLARFKREAHVLASLNHPNIAQIYGLEESVPSGGSGRAVLAIVMELVEGPTLAEAISRQNAIESGKSPQATAPSEGEARQPRGGGAPRGIVMNDALPIARQMADALEAAHEQGVTHRDLKPANIKVRPDGVVKVLDFGLAAVVQPGPADPQLTNSPTLSMQATRAGVILGTAGYMSPEQASGKTVDKRADIWAFGVVLFELLTGKRLFEGETIAHTLADVLRAEIDFSKLPADTPATLRELLRRCLDREARRRLRDIGEARLILEHAIAHPEDAGRTLSGPPISPAAGPQKVRPTFTSRALPWAVAGTATAGLVVAIAIWAPWRAPAASPEMRVEIVTPVTTDPISFALSPDGRQLVFVASGNGAPRLWLRALSATVAQPLAGTEGAAYPFWSPDSQSVAFFADGSLKRLDLAGGAPRPLGAAIARGGTWNADGVILFTRTTGSPLSRVAASGGGEAVTVTKLDRQQSHRWPQFLPDGRHFVFYAQGTTETAGVYLGSIDSENSTRLTPADTAGAYASSGWLYWVRAGTLVAQRLDLGRRALVGDSVTVADPVAFDGNTRVGAFSVSATGLLAYRPGSANRRQLQWFDRTGKMLGALGAPDDSQISAPRLSPDDRRVLAWRTVQGNADVWMTDGAQLGQLSRVTRMTFDAVLDRYAAWSPDGSRIVFDSNRKGVRNLYIGPANSPGSEILLLESAEDKYVSDWSPDGRFLLFGRRDPQRNYDLWLLPLGGDKKPLPFLQSNFLERGGFFSPDGRWLADQSDESTRPEVYIRRFVVPTESTGADRAAGSAGGQFQVSTAGGIHPRWRRDGKELYFVGPDGQMMAVPIALTATTVEVGTPVALFQPRMVGGGADNGQGWQYDVARDGRFLINTVLDDVAAPITILLNWQPPANP